MCSHGSPQHFYSRTLSLSTCIEQDTAYYIAGAIGKGENATKCARPESSESQKKNSMPGGPAKGEGPNSPMQVRRRVSGWRLPVIRPGTGTCTRHLGFEAGGTREQYANSHYPWVPALRVPPQLRPKR